MNQENVRKLYLPRAIYRESYACRESCWPAALAAVRGSLPKRPSRWQKISRRWSSLPFYIKWKAALLAALVSYICVFLFVYSVFGVSLTGFLFN